MTKKITGEEPANAVCSQYGPLKIEGTHKQAIGLTIRQHFAAMAMQGLLSCGATYNGKSTDRTALAKDAIAHADALINELNKQEEKQ